ncbi:unnamed protein product [Caenorhabditis angaria]|uniref:Uncharacterized protein n=1 Tax=Caenorhabditis angaria TaxID=860376 RepID=A0A9P1N8P9_9PELO|nr:unnamed protein product [Caenorhabditis angaria]
MGNVLSKSETTQENAEASPESNVTMKQMSNVSSKSESTQRKADATIKSNLNATINKELESRAGLFLGGSKSKPKPKLDEQNYSKQDLEAIEFVKSYITSNFKNVELLDGKCGKRVFIRRKK